VRELESARDDINRLVYDALGSDRSETLQELLAAFLDAVEGLESEAASESA
jgi:hypothetical protein